MKDYEVWTQKDKFLVKTLLLERFSRCRAGFTELMQHHFGKCLTSSWSRRSFSKGLLGAEQVLLNWCNTILINAYIRQDHLSKIAWWRMLWIQNHASAVCFCQFLAFFLIFNLPRNWKVRARGLFLWVFLCFKHFGTFVPLKTCLNSGCLASVWLLACFLQAFALDSWKF